MVSSLRTQGPIATGCRGQKEICHSRLTLHRHGVWVPACAGTTPVTTLKLTFARPCQSRALHLVSARFAALFWAGKGCSCSSVG